MVQSLMFDGKTPHWYHYMCFFGRQRPKSVGDISHFESQRWEDQEKIKKNSKFTMFSTAGCWIF
ncbi:Poly [ADP-ribose] polymerase [Zootermopsis nevadensis]|uniref:Poly [ADP-ribose] polymerase n=1 Tax=Zootermopsis nevadensis TaxID=136037 RepID=A0A067QHZ9_ZOONE|nr:Poly [ADP-ribose] polymerase [Zootermopsis nevadensis]